MGKVSPDQKYSDVPAVNARESSGDTIDKATKGITESMCKQNEELKHSGIREVNGAVV